MNYIVFNPYNDFKIEEEVQLVIYDIYNKNVFDKIILPANGEIELEHDRFEKHWEYKYKYQAKNHKDDWEDCSKTKRVKPELINENNLKYILHEYEGSDILLVIFQAINTTPTYNYISTLHKFKVNKLFIKDDYGEDPKTRSSYYLGKNKSLHIADATQSLIEETIKKLNINRNHVIFLGSSKGGFASLYHGYRYGSSYIIAGGPQVLLGNYLSSTGGIGIPIFNSIIGDVNEDNIKWGNDLLKDVLSTAKHPYPRTYIHVGMWEPHFKKHVMPFMNLAHELSIDGVELNISDYKTHKELIKYFPDYVKKTLREILESFE